VRPHSARGPGPSHNPLSTTRAALSAAALAGMDGGSPSGLSPAALLHAAQSKTAQPPLPPKAGPDAAAGPFPRPVITAKPLVIRTGFELQTPKMADLAIGAMVQLYECRKQIDGAVRACIGLSATTRGWCTMVSRDGTLALVETGSDAATAVTDTVQRVRRSSISGHLSARGDPGSARGGVNGGSSVPAAAAAVAAHGSSGGGASAGVTGPSALPTYVISAPKALLSRAEFDLRSSRVGELPPGTKVHVLETRPLPDGGKRVRLALQGQDVPYGWVTAVTKSGQENLQPHLFEVVAAKPLLVRADFETKSGKLGEIAPGTLVFVLETRDTPDGSRRMRFAFAAPTGGMQEGGWVTSLTKDGTENVREAVMSSKGGGVRRCAHRHPPMKHLPGLSAPPYQPLLKATIIPCMFIFHCLPTFFSGHPW
jgi:hypothetical protein